MSLHRLQERYDAGTLDTWLWPPKTKNLGWHDRGKWDQRTGRFSSIYERRARELQTSINLSEEQAILARTKVRFENTSIDVTPVGSFNRLPTAIPDSPDGNSLDGIPQFNVLYRGAKKIYVIFHWPQARIGTFRH